MGVVRVDRTLEFLGLTGTDEGIYASRVTEASAFFLDASELRQDLVSLEQLVQTAEPKYLQPSSFIRIKGSAKMSDRERDEFDSDITDFVKNCSLKIDALQDATQGPHATVSLLEHEKEIIAYLLERLKVIAGTTRQLQKQRVALPFLTSHRLLPSHERLALADRESETLKVQGAFKAASQPPLETGTTLQSTLAQRRPPRPPAVVQAPVFASQNETIEFTEQQHERFHAENVTLHRHLQENVEDAKQMEAKMAEISTLVSQFTDKLLEQDTDIKMIHDYAKETSNNIQQSNKILEKTKEAGNGYGFMIFCFYAFFSLLLHALHYFNA